MLFNLKSWSKTVYDEEFDEPDAAPEQVLLPQKKLQVVAEEEPPPESTSGTSDADDGVVGGGWSTSLTVWRKSLVMNCNGFTVINADGDLVYRVDNYSGRPEEITLMDAAGNSVLTLLHHTKRLGLVDSWLVYDGDAEAAVGGNMPATAETVKYVPKKPIWCVKKQKNLLLQGSNGNSVLAYVYRGSSGKREYSYAIEGSYGQRSCKVVEYESRKEVAEIRRKEAAVGGVSFGAEVFVLSVQTGFDSGFAMALVLLLDQMFS